MTLQTSNLPTDPPPPRAVSPLNRETIRRTTPLAMLALGILFMGYSWRGGITTITDLYQFVYTVDRVPGKIQILGLVLQLVLTLGQFVCSTHGWRRAYWLFLSPDALSTAWALCRDFFFDLARALAARNPTVSMWIFYAIVAAASVAMGIMIAKKGETLIVDNYRAIAQEA